MKKTVIAITGNIASGKSTVAGLVSAQTGICVFDIKEYRGRVFGPGKVGTLKAWQLLTSEIRNQNVAILESSGLSVYEQKVYDHFDQKIIVRLDSPDRVLLSRIKSRSMDHGIPGISLDVTHYKNRISTREKLYQKVKSDLVFNTNSMSAVSIAKEIRLNISLKV